MATDDNWQVRMLDKILAEQEANERLKQEDPVAYEVKMLAQLPTSRCCLCGDTFKGHGHNAHPVRNAGVACDECNFKIVVPQRILKWAAREP